VVPALNNNGSATVVNLTSPETTTSVQLTVNSVSSTTQNVGLAEIQVFPPSGTQVPPTANAGPNQTVAAGSTVTLDGSGSVDPGGNPRYQWTQTGGPAVTLSSSTAVKPTFTAPASAGTLTFQLVVTDGTLTSQPSTVKITVSSTATPTANAGPNQSVATGQTVQLDGSGSVDPGGNPSYQWTQTSGYAVGSLSSATAVKPTFTAPTAGTFTFQLVVTDGSLTSQPSSVTITVSAPSNNIAPLATVTASSQNSSTGQLASAAVDGVVDGYPGNYSHEWATSGGGAGSWLKLAWSSPQAIQTVVLYDRPNLNDQITGGTLTFSDGSTVVVPALNNNGSATVVNLTSPETTTSVQLTVNSVSSTTQNVGLAEIQVLSLQPTAATVSAPASGSAGSAIAAGSIGSTLSGATSGATGKITFTVFGPLASPPTSCTSGGTAVGTASVSGNGSYSPSAGYTPAAAGTYWWYASYAGDANDGGSNSGCGSGMTSTTAH
jgi:hypothetical protein